MAPKRLFSLQVKAGFTAPALAIWCDSLADSQFPSDSPKGGEL